MYRRVSELFLFDMLVNRELRVELVEALIEENKHLKFIVDILEGIN